MRARYRGEAAKAEDEEQESEDRGDRVTLRF